MESFNKLRKLYDGEANKGAWLARFDQLVTVALSEKLDKAKRAGVVNYLREHLKVLPRSTLLRK